MWECNEKVSGGAGFDNIVAFDDFTKDETRQGRWRVLIKKKKTLVKVEFKI